MEEKLLELVVLQHKMMKDITKSFDYDTLLEEDRENFLFSIHGYVGSVAAFVEMNGIKVPYILKAELDSWKTLVDKETFDELITVLKESLESDEFKALMSMDPIKKRVDVEEAKEE